MTFNKDSRFDSSNVRRRRPSSGGSGSGGNRGGSGLGILALFSLLGRRGGIGGIIVVVVVLFILNALGVSIGQFFGGMFSAMSGDSSYSEEDFQCTGAEANASTDCRIEGASVSLEQFWPVAAEELGIDDYSHPSIYLYTGQTSSACGTASNAIGPFYCPADASIYIDVEFFDMLVSDYGAAGGPLAEMYVVAHEWGHHVQQVAGILSSANTQDEGPSGGAVRTELQADCFAGAWMRDATTAVGEGGEPLLQEFTRSDIEQTISAAQAIGDDHIQEQAGMEVDPERFTHGTSEQRTTWLLRGYEQGVTSCNTFTVSDSEL